MLSTRWVTSVPVFGPGLQNKHKDSQKPVAGPCQRSFLWALSLSKDYCTGSRHVQERVRGARSQASRLVRDDTGSYTGSSIQIFSKQSSVLQNGDKDGTFQSARTGRENCTRRDTKEERMGPPDRNECSHVTAICDFVSRPTRSLTSRHALTSSPCPGFSRL